MRIGEILRKLADIVDQDEPVTQQEPVQAEPEVGPGTTITVTSTGGEIDPLGTEDECCNDKEQPAVTMVSPLQQEHELLKKSVGVDNNVDEFAAQEEAGYQDELAAMKQSAGIGEEAANAKAQSEQREMESQLNPRRNAAIAFAKARTDRSS